MYAYGLRWGSRLPPGLAGNPTRLSLASVGPTAPSTEENSTLEGWRLLPKKLLSIRCYPTFLPPFFFPLAPTATTLGHNRAVCIASGQAFGFNNRTTYTANLSLLCEPLLFSRFPRIDEPRLILEAGCDSHCFSLTMVMFELPEDRCYSRRK